MQFRTDGNPFHFLLKIKREGKEPIAALTGVAPGGQNLWESLSSPWDPHASAHLSFTKSSNLNPWLCVQPACLSLWRSAEGMFPGNTHTYRLTGGFKGFKSLLVTACLLQTLSLQVSLKHLFQKSLVGTSWALEQWQCLPLFQENYWVGTLTVKGVLTAGVPLCLPLQFPKVTHSCYDNPTAQPLTVYCTKSRSPARSTADNQSRLSIFQLSGLASLRQQKCQESSPILGKAALLIRS